MVLDLVILTHLLLHLVVLIGGIIGDYLSGQPISANYFLLDEFYHHIPSHISI